MSFVGTGIREQVVQLVSEQGHVVIVAPPGHGKSTLVATVLTSLKARGGVTVQRADPTAPWSRVRSHIENFAKRCLLPCESGLVKVFVVDDLDIIAACDKSCLSDLREILKRHRSHLVVVLTCLPALLPKLTRVLTLAARVDAYPVPVQDLVAFGSSISKDTELCERAATQSRGSLPRCVSLLQSWVVGGDRDVSTQLAHALRIGGDTTSEAVASVLRASPDLAEMDRTLGSFGGHMFVDTVFHNACRTAGLSLDTYVEHAIRYVLMGSGSHALNTLEKETRDQVNLARCAEWRGVGRTRDNHRIDFTNTLALCNARAACRKKIAVSACSRGLTCSEMVFAAGEVRNFNSSGKNSE